MNDVIVIGGGQSGLVAARTLRAHGLAPVVLEAGPKAVGSWPHYYDSLTVFSPAEYSSMPGLPFRGEPGHYPHRDEVTDYLGRYAAGLDVEIRTNAKVDAVEASEEGRGFVVHINGGETVRAAGIVSASGSFANPHLPSLPGQDTFTGRLLHVADYRNPKPYAGERVVVVGAGNSAVQVGYELATVASATVATRHPFAFWPQRRQGRDLHYWLARSGFDRLPPEWLAHFVTATRVVDTGDYRTAVTSGRLDCRPMFTAFDGNQIIWADDTPEKVDTVLFATGYRPNLDYLDPLGALDNGAPLHAGGISTTHPGLVYLGLEFQRSFASNTLRGVHVDADYVIPPLVAYLSGAPGSVGL